MRVDHCTLHGARTAASCSIPLTAIEYCGATRLSAGMRCAESRRKTLAATSLLFAPLCPAERGRSNARDVNREQIGTAARIQKKLVVRAGCPYYGSDIVTHLIFGMI